MSSALYFLIALFIHEGFHLLVGHVFFREGIRICFLPGGFRAQWKNFYPEKWAQCIIYASGPAGNLITAAIVALLPISNGISKELVKANLIIGLFNLIPLYPMDGGSIMLILLYSRVGSNQTVKIMRRTGYGIRLFLLVTGLCIFIAYNNPSLFVTIALLPGIQSIGRSVRRLNLNAMIRRRERILKKKAYPVRHILILKEVSLGEALLLMDYDQYHILHIANHDLEIILQISEQQFIDAILCQDAGKTFEQVFNLE